MADHQPATARYSGKAPSGLGRRDHRPAVVPDAGGLPSGAVGADLSPHAGTTRLEGFLVLRKVTLKPEPQPPIDGSRVK